MFKGRGTACGGGIQDYRKIISKEVIKLNYKHNPKLTNVARMLRKNMTKEEKHLWYDFLRNYPIRFLRQKVIDNYVVDFYCHDAKLIIELDGSQHYTSVGQYKDEIRTKKLEKHNLTVIRIPNSEIKRNFNNVCDYIDNWIKNNIKGTVKKRPCDKL